MLGISDKRALRGRGAASNEPKAAQPKASQHWLDRIGDGRRIRPGSQVAAASDDAAAGAAQPSQSSQALWAAEHEAAGRDGGLPAPPRHETSRNDAGQGGYQQQSPFLRFEAEEFHPGSSNWGGGDQWLNDQDQHHRSSSSAQGPAPGVWLAASPSDRQSLPHEAEPWETEAAQSLEQKAEPPEPWETEPAEPPQPEPWEAPAAARETHGASTPITVWSSSAHGSPPKLSPAGSAQDPSSQMGSPARPSDEASGSQAAVAGPPPQTAGASVDASESAGVPRIPVGPPAECVKTFAGDENLLPVERGDRVVLTHPEQDDMFCGHNLRTGETKWVPRDVVGLPPEDRDPATLSSAPPPLRPPPAKVNPSPKPQPPVLPAPAKPKSPLLQPQVLNGHQPTPALQAPPAAASCKVGAVPYVGMTVWNSRNQKGTVENCTSGNFRVVYDGQKSWTCSMDRFVDEHGQPLVEGPVNGCGAPTVHAEAPVRNGHQPGESSGEVLNGTSAAAAVHKEPWLDKRWETFTDPASNSIWFWHSESKEWFFRQNPHEHWSRFLTEDGRGWWWNKESEAFFFEKVDQSEISGGS